MPQTAPISRPAGGAVALAPAIALALTTLVVGCGPGLPRDFGSKPFRRSCTAECRVRNPAKKQICARYVDASIKIVKSEDKIERLPPGKKSSYLQKLHTSADKLLRTQLCPKAMTSEAPREKITDEPDDDAPAKRPRPRLRLRPRPAKTQLPHDFDSAPFAAACTTECRSRRPRGKCNNEVDSMIRLARKTLRAVQLGKATPETGQLHRDAVGMLRTHLCPQEMRKPSPPPQPAGKQPRR